MLNGCPIWASGWQVAEAANRASGMASSLWEGGEGSCGGGGTKVATARGPPVAWSRVPPGGGGPEPACVGKASLELQRAPFLLNGAVGSCCRQGWAPGSSQAPVLGLAVNWAQHPGSEPVKGWC